MSYYFNNGGGSWVQRIPQATRALLIINIAVWLLCALNSQFNYITISRLGLHFWESRMFNPLQLVTYQFVHGGVTHIFFNMFALYMFGSLLERVWGTGRYLLFYFICGIGAGLVQEVIWSISWQHEYISAVAADNGLSYNYIKDTIQSQIQEGAPERMGNVAQFWNMLITVGASGAIFGLLVGFAFVFPNMPMYIFFIPVPIKAKYIVIGYGLIEIVFGATGALNSVAHYAHIGGMLFGLIIVLYWRYKGNLYGKRF